MDLKQLLIAFGVAFGVTALLTPLVISLAHARGWVAHPRADRWHKKPTALMGGIAVYLGTMGGLAASGSLQASNWALWLGASSMFLLGLVDDRLRIRPHVKLVAQIAAACWLMMSGIRFEAIPMPWAILVTLLWLIGITNAVNLLDNMDGLAAGVVGIGALVMAGYGALDGNLAIAPMALPVAGACAAFLMFNFNPARVFMGDCGSMFLGFTLASVAIVGTHRTAPNLMIALFVPVAILAVPIFDTTLVTIARRLAGRPVSEGGRDHSSHRLVALGLSERDCVLAFYALSAVFGGLALASKQLPLPVTVVLAVLLFLGLAGIGVFLGMIQVHKPVGEPSDRQTVLTGMVMYKKQILQVLVDALLIPIAYVAATLLRFDGNIPEPIMQALLSTLPFIMAIKLMALSMTRAYRGVWRYAGMSDVLAVVKGSTLGSVVAALLLAQATSFLNLSRAALILDWILFTNLAVGARVGLAVLRHLFAGVAGANAPRVLILGAGPAGIAAAQALTDPHAQQRAAVVGFLDDDPSKQQRTLNGYPVLGLLQELPEVLDEEHVDTCVLALTPSSSGAETAQSFCELRGIPYSWATGQLMGEVPDGARPELVGN